MILVLSLIFLGSVVSLFVNFSLLHDLDQQLQTEGERLQRLTQAQSAADHPFNTAFFDHLVQEEKDDEFAPDTPHIKLLDTHQARILRRSANLVRERIPLSNTDYMAALQGQHIVRTYIASLITEAHGGVLTVESKLDKGTSFCIWLPTCTEL